MADPIRIQRKRARGWKLPPNAVCVTRPGRWGNRWRAASRDGFFWFCVGPNGFAFPCPCKADAEAMALQCFSKWARNEANAEEIRSELRGKSLACWCPIGSPCHADILLEVANG